MVHEYYLCPSDDMETEPGGRKRTHPGVERWTECLLSLAQEAPGTAQRLRQAACQVPLVSGSIRVFSGVGRGNYARRTEL